MRSSLRSARMFAEHSLPAGVQLLVGTLAASILAYAAIAAMARLLTAADFGLLGTLLGLLSIATVLVRPLHTVATVLATEAHVRHEPEMVPLLVSRALS